MFYLIEQVKFWQLLADVDLLYFQTVAQPAEPPVRGPHGLAMSKLFL